MNFIVLHSSDMQPMQVNFDNVLYMRPAKNAMGNNTVITFKDGAKLYVKEIIDFEQRHLYDANAEYKEILYLDSEPVMLREPRMSSEPTKPSEPIGKSEPFSQSESHYR